MNEKTRSMIQTVLTFNKDFVLVPDTGRGFRREGHKDVVEPELRIFNGQPQLVIFYGKVRYTFNIQARANPDKVAALMCIRGYQGVENIEEVLLADFPKEAVQVRKRALKERGV